MPKKVKSYALSEEAIKEILDYKEANKCKSESDALDRMLLERTKNTDDEVKIRKIVMEILSKFQISMTQEESKLPQQLHDEVEQALKNSMDDIFKQLGED